MLLNLIFESVNELFRLYMGALNWKRSVTNVTKVAHTEVDYQSTAQLSYVCQSLIQ